MAMVTKEENPVTVAAAANVNLPQTLSPESAAPVSHTDREVNTNTTPIALEKPSEDGFNWRKYGQKNVKGNEYVRSYYKCSYPNCSVKKQIERSHDGRITDVTYLGSHEHAKPISEPKGVSVPLLRPHCPPSAAIANEDKTSDKFGADDVQPMNVEITTVTVPDDPTPMPVTPLNQRRDEHNESLTPKRRKKTADVTDITPEKPGQESRLVIQTVSEVDIVNDGYRWRKYGQKMVKGNPNPRSYYRCSTAGCPVKKHVERASYDPKVVITTYEGQHDHNLPPVRTILPQSPSAPSSGGVEPNGAEKSKSEESDDARHPTVEEKDAPSVTVEGDSEKLSSDDNSDRMTEETERVQVETKVEVSKTEPKEAEAEADSGRLTKSEISKTEPKDVKPEIPKTDPKDGATDSTVSLTKPEISTTEPTDMETEISTTPEPKDVKTEISTTPEPKDGATTDSGSLTKPEISKTEPTDMDTENVKTEISKTPEAKDVKTEISETEPKDNVTVETDSNTVVEKTAEEPGKC